MANHTIDCDFCGKDMRGRVKGCHSQQEADRCCHFDAKAALTALRAELDVAVAAMVRNNERAETAEARNAELMKALEVSRQVLAKLLSAGHNCPSATPEEVDAAFWSVDAALGGQSNG